MKFEFKIGNSVQNYLLRYVFDHNIRKEFENHKQFAGRVKVKTLTFS